MSRPLAGLEVVVTRAAHQADELVVELERAGAAVERLPLIAVVAGDAAALARAAGALASFDWVVFTSANAVEAFVPLVDPWPAALRAAAVGPATAEALRRKGIEPDRVASDARGEGLAGELGSELGSGAAVLLPQGDDARPETAAALRARGARVEVVVAYRKERPPGLTARVEALASRSGVWVTVTSPRIARELADLAGLRWPELRSAARFVAIGATTAAELRRLGVEPAVASAPRPRAMVEAIVAAETGG